MSLSPSTERTDLPSSATGPDRRRPRLNTHLLALGTVLGCQLMVVVDATIVNVALPDIQRSLGFSTSSLSWVINAYTLTFGGLLLLGARLGDILGRRRTFLSGLTVFVLASAFGGFATDTSMLLVARTLQGIGGAIAAPAALALLMTTFPDGQLRTRALALFTAVSIGGFSLGLVLGGALVQWLDWRWVFFVNVPIGLIVIVTGMVSLPRSAPQSGSFDLQGATYSTVGIGAIVYGLVHASTSGWSSSVTITALVVGAALLAAFIAVESRARQPITPLRLFASTSRSSAHVGRLVIVAGFLGVLFFLTQFMQEVLNFGAFETGLAYLPMTAATFASSQLSARVLLPRISIRTHLVVAFAVVAAGLYWLSAADSQTSYLWLLGPFIVLGAGCGAAMLGLTTAALRGVHPDDAGAASGLVNTSQQLGGTVGLAVLIAVFGAATTGMHQSTATFAHGVSVTVLAAAILVSVGCLLMAVTQGERRAVASNPAQR